MYDLAVEIQGELVAGTSLPLGRSGLDASSSLSMLFAQDDASAWWGGALPLCRGVGLIQQVA